MKLTKRQISTINELEALMTKKTKQRSQLNYEITHIRETIQLINDSKK